MKLTKTNATLAKTDRKTYTREAYENEEGQIYLPPKSIKKHQAWIKKMEDKGFEVPPLKT